MQKLIFINNNDVQIDLTSGSFGITNWAGLSNTELNIQTQQVPFQDGSVFLDALMEPREIELTLAIYDGNNLELRYQKKRELISALNPKLGEGILIYINDCLSRQIKAVPHIPLFENKNSNDAGTLKATLVFSCPSPYWEDLEETSITFKGNIVVENNGDIPATVKIETQIGCKNPTLINQTLQKEISLTGEFNNDININTENGKKSINEEELKFEWNQGLVSFTSLAYGDNKCVYVSPTLIIIESLSTGKFKSVNVNLSLNKIIYGNNLFVAVGSKIQNETFIPAIIVSDDGENWQEQTLPSGLSGTLNSICFDNNLFVAVGENGVILKSSDGESWESVSVSYFTSKTLYDVKRINNYWVIVGAEGFLFEGMALTQGTVKSSGTNEDLHSIVYSSYFDRVLVVGNNGSILTGRPIQPIGGFTWSYTQQGTDNFNKVISIQEKYYIVGQTNLTSSSDGVSWTSETLSQGTLKDIESGYGSITIVGSNAQILNSSNGESWTFKKNYIVSKKFQDVKYFDKPELFVIICNQGSIYKSKDGESWTYKNISENKLFYSIIYSEKKGLFVIVGSSIFTSSDCENWQDQGRPSGLNGILNSATYSKKLELFVAVSSSGQLITSSDGINWSSPITITNSSLTSIVYSEKLELFAVTTNNGKIFTSPDVETWVEKVSVNNGCFYSITYSEEVDLFVAVGKSASTVISKDGVNWNVKTSLISQFRDYIYVDYLKNQFIVLYIDSQNMYGGCLKSSDAVNWYLLQDFINSFNVYNLKAVTYSKKLDLFILVSENNLEENYTDAIFNSTYSKSNIINKLTNNSDMSFLLNVGKNNILYFDENNLEVKITFKQKYIGV